MHYNIFFKHAIAHKMAKITQHIYQTSYGILILVIQRWKTHTVIISYLEGEHTLTY
jgi:hypothetical protein